MALKPCTIVIFLLMALVTYKLLFRNEDEIDENEHFMGALIQLRAKGPQDRYLTIDGRPNFWRNRTGWNDGYYGPYADEFIWNNSTRIPKWSTPPYVYVDEYLRNYPYQYYYW